MSPTTIQIGSRFLSRDEKHTITVTGSNDRVNGPRYPWQATVAPITGPEHPWHASFTADGRYYLGTDSRYDMHRELPPLAGDPAVVEERASLKPWPFPGPAGVGDVNSDAKGSGARYNTGKTPFELVPLRLLAADLSVRHGSTPAVQALDLLGQFQERHPAAREKLLAALDVLCPDSLEGWNECAQVFDFGRAKYAEWNWAKGMAWSVPLACAARHLLAMINGEPMDPDSRKPHRGHVFCNVVMLLTYLKTFTEGDDRPKAGYLSQVSA